MPRPVSDAYDPEWGTRANAQPIIDALSDLYGKLSKLLGDRPPMFIVDLVNADLPETCTATLTEKEWRLLRFAIERASDSI